jgi:predicted ATP-grasp superfamily ATP-dependent carboligase
VGTTADYIAWIQSVYPGQALFFTDPEVRRTASEPRPAAADELCGNLFDNHRASQWIEDHLNTNGQVLDGIACFDCESMELTAVLAGHFKLPYPSVQAVRNCRDKLLAKRLWQAHQLNTPPSTAIGSVNEALAFFRAVGAPVVLKPTSGSGSELVFKCRDAPSCADSYRLIRRGLQQRRTHRLYCSGTAAADPLIMAEGFADGPEYSCDFTVEDGRAHVIRLARKIKARGEPFGTVLGYLLPAQLPAMVSKDHFDRILYQSATALGIERGVCMLDFIVNRGDMVLLELAPRPGGDCLPFLLRRGFGLDMIKLQLDFSRRKTAVAPPLAAGKPLVGLRLLSRHSGTFKGVDVSVLKSDARVIDIQLIRQPGHRIMLPPADYDSWLLGHVVFAPNDQTDLDIQCSELLDLIPVEVA